LGGDDDFTMTSEPHGVPWWFPEHFFWDPHIKKLYCLEFVESDNSSAVDFSRTSRRLFEICLVSVGSREILHGMYSVCSNVSRFTDEYTHTLSRNGSTYSTSTRGNISKVPACQESFSRRRDNVYKTLMFRSPPESATYFRYEMMKWDRLCNNTHGIMIMYEN